MTHGRMALAAVALAAAVLLGPGAATALGQTPAAAPAAAATLPFTGADLGELAGTGIALIGAGALLRSRA